MTSPLFDINDDGEDHGYDATPEEVLTLKLREQPSGAFSVRFQVFDLNDYDPEQDTLINPPLKSKGADDILLDNGQVIASSVSPLTTDAEVTTELPDQTGVAWIIRCVVNDGKRTVGDRLVLDPSLIHERMVVIRTDSGRRPIVATETIQYDPVYGWAGELADLLTAVSGPATGSDTGYVARYVYVNAASTKVGTTFAGVVVAAAPSQWTTVDDIPPGSEFLVDTAGGGSGGSSGNSNTGSNGGPAAGGGARNRRLFMRADLIAALPIVFTIGLGGIGGVQNTGGSTKVVGGTGGNAFFGNLLTAYGGAPGGAGATGTQGGPGGGTMGQPAAPGTSVAALAGGLPSPATAQHGAGFDGAGVLVNSSNETAQRARCAVWGGGSGGGIRTNSGSAQLPGGEGGRSQYGGGGGGAGGSGGPNSGDFAAGGPGGKSGGQVGGSITGGGAAGGAGVSGSPGNPGSDGADGNAEHNGDGGGGGGSTGQANTGVGGKGGKGGFPGGGGGGGGGTRFGAAGENPGDGGDGGDAMIMITVLR